MVLPDALLIYMVVQPKQPRFFEAYMKRRRSKDEFLVSERLPNQTDLVV